MVADYLGRLTVSRALGLLFLLTALLSAPIIFIASNFIKHYTVKSLATEESSQTAELVFQSLFAVMKRSWAKEDINEIISDFERIDSTVDINLHRGPQVEELYGKIEDSNHPLTKDKEIVARIGGDEFLVLIPESNQEIANLVAIRIKEIISATQISWGSSMLSVDCSLGGSFYPQDGDNIDNLIKLADQRMYQDKQNSRVRR